MSAAPPPRLYALWLHDNRAAIRVSGPSSSALAAAARAELATPNRYHLQRVVQKQSRAWWQVVWDWMMARFRAFVRALAAHVKVGIGLRRIFGDVIVVSGLLVVAFVAARLLRALQVARDREREGPVLHGHRQNAHALSVRANALARDGDYNLAIRVLFAAAVALLNVRGFLHADASATVNELDRALQVSNSSVEPAFVSLARRFTEASYAECAVGSQEWDEACQAYQSIASSLTPA